MHRCYKDWQGICKTVILFTGQDHLSRTPPYVPNKHRKCRGKNSNLLLQQQICKESKK